MASADARRLRRSWRDVVRRELVVTRTARAVAETDATSARRLRRAPRLAGGEDSAWRVIAIRRSTPGCSSTRRRTRWEALDAGTPYLRPRQLPGLEERDFSTREDSRSSRAPTRASVATRSPPLVDLRGGCTRATLRSATASRYWPYDCGRARAVSHRVRADAVLMRARREPSGPAIEPGSAGVERLDDLIPGSSIDAYAATPRAARGARARCTLRRTRIRRGAHLDLIDSAWLAGGRADQNDRVRDSRRSKLIGTSAGWRTARYR